MLCGFGTDVQRVLSMLIVMPVAVVILSPCAEAAADTISQIEVSKGVAACVIEPPPALNLAGFTTSRCTGYSYLPPGTVVKIKAVDAKTKERLLETRWGITVRTKFADRFWRDEELTDFINQGQVAFVIRDYTLPDVMSLGGDAACVLTRGETYKTEGISANDPSSWKITLTSRKAQCVEPESTRQALVPKSSVIIVDFLQRPIAELDGDGSVVDIRPFTARPVRNALSYTKKCGEKIDTTGKVSGEVGFNLMDFLGSWFPALSPGIRASLGAEGMVSFAKESPEGLQEQLTYYTGDDAIHIAQKKECAKTNSGYRVPAAYWHYVATSTQNADLDADWSKSNLIPLNKSTNSPQISCARDYFVLADALRDVGFSPSSIPFIAAKIANIQNFGNDTACISEK